MNIQKSSMQTPQIKQPQSTPTNKHNDSKPSGALADPTEAMIQGANAASPPAPPKDTAEFNSRANYEREMRNDKKMIEDLDEGPNFGDKREGGTGAKAGVMATQAQRSVQEVQRRHHHQTCANTERMLEIQLNNKNREVERAERAVRIREGKIAENDKKIEEKHKHYENLRNDKNEYHGERQRIHERQIKDAQTAEQLARDEQKENYKKLEEERIAFAATKEEQAKVQKEFESAKWSHQKSH